MCLLKNKTIKNKALCVIGIGIVLTIIIFLIVGIRYNDYIFPLYNTKVDANITSSFGTVISAFITPLWSGIAVWIYYLALNVQSKELKASQETAFGQNLSFLISNSTDILNNLHIKINKNIEYHGHDVITFQYLCMKYCYNILKEEKIVAIPDWEIYQEEIKGVKKNEYFDEERMIEEYEWERLSIENPQLYRMVKKEEIFNKYKNFFIYLLELTNDDIKDRNDGNQCVISSFLKIWSKYGHYTMSYFLSIGYIYKYINSCGSHSIRLGSFGFSPSSEGYGSR